MQRPIFDKVPEFGVIMADSSAYFRRTLARNIALPLATALTNAVFFVALVLYLLSIFNLSDDTDATIIKSDGLIQLSVSKQTGLRGYLITGDQEFLNRRQTTRHEFTNEMAELKELVAENPAQVERLERIELMKSQWEEYAQTVIDMKRENENFSELVHDRGAGEFADIHREFEEFKEVERGLQKERSSSAIFITVVTVLIYLLVSVVLMGCLSLFGRKELINLSESYSTSLAQLKEHTSALEQQTWQRLGQARLAERCTGQTALPVLGRAILDFLAQYLNVAVGAMYVWEEKASALQRVATFGFSNPTEPCIKDAESLVEQAAYSNRLIHLTDVPEGYLKVSSGIGSSTPRSVILLPIEHENNVNGVIELGSFQTLEPQHLEFLRLVAPSIGNTIEMALNRSRLQAMLEETQQLNEELQVQQEQLSSSNEELEEQSRMLEESQVLLENQKSELEQTNEQLTHQAAILDQKNMALNVIQAELQDRARELEQASNYKSEFLANISHELRTPLNSSMILAKMLAENPSGNLSDEQVQFATRIYSAGDDLLNLINDILDISKVEAGKLDLNPVEVSVGQLVDALKMTFEPVAQQKGLQFTAEISADTPQSIDTDLQRLEQILRNLLSNALKFTDEGYVHLTVNSGPHGSVSFSVKDTGLGIAEDQQEVVFEAFQQSDGGINRRYGGTGLGLSISQNLADLLGGLISVESVLGEGSTFTLVLPPSLPKDAPPAEESILKLPELPPVPLRSRPEVQPAPQHFADDRDKVLPNQRTVLVIEDDPKFARILYDLAHELNYRTLVALTALEGLQMANDSLPDAILLDIGLPDVSGMSVLQKLKVNSVTRHIPVHIVSAADRTEVALQLGAIGYVIKPATRDRLKEVFQKLESKLTQKMKRVLLVEDDQTQREAVVKLIGDQDVDITAAESGEQAIELLRNTIFDCMVIDLKLPDMQGHELLQRMATQDLCSFPPVIVYTARNLTRDEEADLFRYSRSIIIKGARSPERLLDEVTLFLHKVEAKMSPERQFMLRSVRGRDRVLEGRRILLVDDDVRNIFALAALLEQKGAVIETARDGFEAIEKVHNDIDLVLMDIMMPGMDGLEAMRRIRNEPQFQKLPIIAITAKAMKDDQDQCIKAGASDYLAKPIDIDRLYSLLRVWMPNVERI